MPVVGFLPNHIDLSPPPVGADSTPLRCCFNIWDPPQSESCVSFLDQRVFLNKICKVTLFGQHG